jgi:hypothetical protein
MTIDVDHARANDLGNEAIEDDKTFVMASSAENCLDARSFRHTLHALG